MRSTICKVRKILIFLLKWGRNRAEETEVESFCTMKQFAVPRLSIPEYSGISSTLSLRPCNPAPPTPTPVSSGSLTLKSKTLPGALMVGSRPGLGMAKRIVKTDHGLGVWEDTWGLNFWMSHEIQKSSGNLSGFKMQSLKKPNVQNATRFARFTWRSNCRGTP